MTRLFSLLAVCACVLLSALALAAPAGADGALPQPPVGTPPNAFAPLPIRAAWGRFAA